MADEFGAMPRHGFARMVPELHVNELERSLAFWRDVVGFAVAYRRPAEGFVYLERPEGAQVMLCQRHGRYETGPMERPLGQGAMFQVYVDDLAAVLTAISVAGWPVYQGPREVWRRTGTQESGMREVFVQDPDGYLLMVAQNIGRRPIVPPAAEDGTRGGTVG